MKIKVIINGVAGKMGRVTQEAIASQKDLLLVAGLEQSDDLHQAIQDTHADVVIDFTTPHTVFKNTQIIIAAGARPVIGTSGLTVEQIATLETWCAKNKRGGMIAPNFSLSAVLMMKYAKDAANYFPHVEIIEMHHEHKIDAPSGTATKTAQLIAANRTSPSNNEPHKDRARGEQHQGISIHSIRLPGLFSHQAVIFGATGETLTIKHDGIDRHAMMPGVFLSCRKVMELDHLVYGLENIL